MREGYSVTVSKWGEPLVTIEIEMLAGKAELSDDDLNAIRDAAAALESFAGPDDPQPCFVCGGVDRCRSDCALRKLDDAQAASSLTEEAAE